MKVLHIINELTVDGGAENLVKDLVLRMNEKHCKTDVLVLRWENNLPVQELIDKGICVLHSGSDNIYSPIQINKIMKIIHGYDIVHTHLFPSQYWYIISKLIARSGAKSVTTEHSTSNRRRNNIFFKYPEKLIYSSYDKVICISRGAERKLLEWIPSIAGKIVTIHNGIDISKFRNCEPYERECLIPGLVPGSKLILMVARMDVQKDFETLIMAAKLLTNDYHIVLVGDGPLKRKLQSLASELGISHRVHFLGVRNDVNRILKSADLFVLSSNWEGFGLVAVEAMASGLPVLASNVSGLSDIVNGYGVLFNKGDSEELAGLIQGILQHESTYRNMSERCEKRAEEFGIDKTVDNYLELYEDLIRR